MPSDRKPAQRDRGFSFSAYLSLPKSPRGWVGAGALRPTPIKVRGDPCGYCRGTGKDYRNCWDIGDAMFPDDCLTCDGTGEATA